MADGLIKKIFSFGRKPQAAAAADETAAGAPPPAEQTAAGAEQESAAQNAAALTPFEAYQAERRAKAARKEQRRKARAAKAAEPKPQRQISEAGLAVRGAGAAPAAAAAQEDSAGFLARLKRGMAQSSQRLNGALSGAFSKRKLDEAALEELEDMLLQADLGLETAQKICAGLRARRFGKDTDEEALRAVTAEEITAALAPCAQALELDLSHKPHVILVVGVNGTGKTTTIGKLAAKLRAGGHTVMLAAGDTFRAAAIEQLHIWGTRADAPVVSSKLGADAAGLAYDAYQKARQAGSDVLLIDTAGRLQNKTELMDELAKIVRVLKKCDPAAPHTVLQNLDATTGQNALRQVEIFQKTARVSGLVMTKLDGTARGGILVAIAARYKLPIYFIGVGEDIADLEPFSAAEFAQAIAGAE